MTKNKTHKVRVIITKVHTIRVLGPSKIKDYKSTKGGHNKKVRQLSYPQDQGVP